jgi:hypothetical protein
MTPLLFLAEIGAADGSREHALQKYLVLKDSRRAVKRAILFGYAESLLKLVIIWLLCKCKGSGSA